MFDTISPLFAIMLDRGEYLSKRIEAAAGILAFESSDDAIAVAKGARSIRTRQIRLATSCGRSSSSPGPFHVRVDECLKTIGDGYSL